MTRSDTTPMLPNVGGDVVVMMIEHLIAFMNPESKGSARLRKN